MTQASAIRLGVNVDHAATLRQARGTSLREALRRQLGGRELETPRLLRELRKL